MVFPKWESFPFSCSETLWNPSKKLLHQKLLCNTQKKLNTVKGFTVLLYSMLQANLQTNHQFSASIYKKSTFVTRPSNARHKRAFLKKNSYHLQNVWKMYIWPTFYSVRMAAMKTSFQPFFKPLDLRLHAAPSGNVAHFNERTSSSERFRFNGSNIS